MKRDSSVTHLTDSSPTPWYRRVPGCRAQNLNPRSQHGKSGSVVVSFVVLINVGIRSARWRGEKLLRVSMVSIIFAPS